jgi:glycogen operon protein
MSSRIWPGRSYPLGASFDGKGVNFAIYSERATKVELCLFDRATGARERETLTLPERTEHVHHGYVHGLGPGQIYGYRVHGPWDPKAGLWFNPAKVVLDPYARAVANEVDPHAPIFGFRKGDPDFAIDPRDDAAGAPKAVVVHDPFDWGNDALPRRPWRDTVIYEVHVKGFTARHPGVPERLRGTYAGLASEAAIRHLVELGVTAVELLPIHEIADEPAVLARGLENYWGYSTLGYFAPAGRYAASGRLGEQVREFKEMVRALHAAGIEVILDVVYNHTAELEHLGPTLSFRGIDNGTYYKLSPRDRMRYLDTTGCGNAWNARHPQALQLVMDSLRYWAVEMRVDGFRFDLATTLGREQDEFDRLAPFFHLVHQDPILADRKMIAEPWDLGPGGYQVGGFPVRWTEWNGKYRDAVRRFWKGDRAITGELGFRLTGSSDLYEGAGRRPHASLNFVTAHDGFTLHDLVSYDRKHNDANGENGRDGNDSNDSWNHGVEGETRDPEILELRERQKRNLLTTLLLSQGVPMLSGGDEIGRTQRGNNNAYCQDNEVSWHDWDLDEPRRALLAFTKRLLALRASQPALRRRSFFSGGYVRGSEKRDVTWISPEGREMVTDDWTHPHFRALGMLLGGDAIPSRNRMGEPIVGDTLLVLMNANARELDFILPEMETAGRWEVLIDTRSADPPHHTLPATKGERYAMLGRSMVVMRLVETKGRR